MPNHPWSVTEPESVMCFTVNPHRHVSPSAGHRPGWQQCWNAMHTILAQECGIYMSVTTPLLSIKILLPPELFGRRFESILFGLLSLPLAHRFVYIADGVWDPDGHCLVFFTTWLLWYCFLLSQHKSDLQSYFVLVKQWSISLASLSDYRWQSVCCLEGSFRVWFKGHSPLDY